MVELLPLKSRSGRVEIGSALRVPLDRVRPDRVRLDRVKPSRMPLDRPRRISNLESVADGSQMEPKRIRTLKMRHITAIINWFLVLSLSLSLSLSSSVWLLRLERGRVIVAHWSHNAAWLHLPITLASRDSRAHSHLHLSFAFRWNLACISTGSSLHLTCISAVSWLCLGRISPASRLNLSCTSSASLLHLARISAFTSTAFRPSRRLEVHSPEVPYEVRYKVRHEVQNKVPYEIPIYTVQLDW